MQKTGCPGLLPRAWTANRLWSSGQGRAGAGARDTPPRLQGRCCPSLEAGWGGRGGCCLGCKQTRVLGSWDRLAPGRRHSLADCNLVSSGGGRAWLRLPQREWGHRPREDLGGWAPTDKGRFVHAARRGGAGIGRGRARPTAPQCGGHWHGSGPLTDLVLARSQEAPFWGGVRRCLNTIRIEPCKFLPLSHRRGEGKWSEKMSLGALENIP